MVAYTYAPLNNIFSSKKRKNEGEDEKNWRKLMLKHVRLTHMSLERTQQILVGWWPHVGWK